MPTEQIAEVAPVPVRFRLRRYIVENRRLKIAKAARELEISPGHLSNILAGEDGVSLQLAARIERWTDGEIPATDWVPSEPDIAAAEGDGRG